MTTKTKTKSKNKTKKAAASTKPRAKASARVNNDAELLARAMALREDGMTIDKIAAELKVTTNKVGFLLLQDSIRPKDRIKGTDEEVAAAIVHGRDELLESWPRLMARTGFSQVKVKAIYAATTGRSANQGYSVVSARNPKEAKPAAKAKTKTKTKAAMKAGPKGKAKNKGKAKTSAARKTKRKSANPS